MHLVVSEPQHARRGSIAIISATPHFPALWDFKRLAGMFLVVPFTEHLADVARPIAVKQCLALRRWQIKQLPLVIRASERRIIFDRSFEVSAPESCYLIDKFCALAGIRDSEMSFHPRHAGAARSCCGANFQSQTAVRCRS